MTESELLQILTEIGYELPQYKVDELLYLSNENGYSVDTILDWCQDNA